MDDVGPQPAKLSSIPMEGKIAIGINNIGPLEFTYKRTLDLFFYRIKGPCQVEVFFDRKALKQEFVQFPFPFCHDLDGRWEPL